MELLKEFKFTNLFERSFERLCFNFYDFQFIGGVQRIKHMCYAKYYIKETTMALTILNRKN